VGLTGLDAGLVDAEPLSEDLGAVGRPVRSNTRLLEVLTGSGFLPVVACIAGDAQGRVYNVNADQMAATCAAVFRASRIVFLTDVDGVRGSGGEILRTISSRQARELIETGVAREGMQAKLEAAISALENQVPEVLIAPGATNQVVETILSSNGSVGTRLCR
jgi:acetylglutamate kinase